VGRLRVVGEMKPREGKNCTLTESTGNVETATDGMRATAGSRGKGILGCQSNLAQSGLTPPSGKGPSAARRGAAQVQRRMSLHLASRGRRRHPILTYIGLFNACLSISLSREDSAAWKCSAPRM
jgi:hypothetical protein